MIRVNKRKPVYERFICKWFSNWRFKDFSLGLTFASQTGEMLGEDSTYEMLNTSDPITVIGYREFYILFLLGFWQFSIGLRVYGKERVV